MTPILEDGTGYQNTDTSLQSAQRVSNSGRVAVLRKRVLDAFHANVFGLTTHEVAELLNESVPSVQPRISELKRDGKLVDAGIRRRNAASGHSAAVMKIAEGAKP